MRSLPFTVDRVAMRVAANQADSIRNAIRSSINIGQIVDSFLATYPDGVVTRAEARDWARLNVVTDNVRLGRALEALWAAGWVLGTDYASEAMRLAAIKKAPTFGIDWSKWKPGQPAAEALVRPPRGLRRLLAKFRNATIKGISATNLDRIGTVLADGLAVGADRRSIAKELMELGIRGIVDDARRALTIAITETSRAVGSATVARYEEMGLRLYEWLTVEGEGVCEACDENAEAGPIAVGQPFPSGDLHEPAHPNCRCKLIPFIENFSTPVRDTVSLGATADAVKYDESQERDESGRWTSGENVSSFEDQKSALGAYRDYAHAAYNSALRLGETLDPHSAEMVKSLKELISSQKPLDHSITVYRGIEGVPEFEDYVAEGQEFTDNGFVSTSKDMSVAEKFGGTVLEITIPAGVSVLDAGNIDVGDPKYRAEQEVILAPGTTLRAIGDTGRQFVVVPKTNKSALISFVSSSSNRFVYSRDEIMLMFNIPSLKFVDGAFITKYDEDQPRDERGRFSTEAGSDTLDQTEALQQIWREGVNRILGVKEGQIPGFARGIPQELKAAVSKNIAEKLLDEKVDVMKLAGVILRYQEPPQAGLYLDVKQAMTESPESDALFQYNVVEISGTGYGVSGLASYDKNADLSERITLEEAQNRVDEINASRAPTEQLVLAGSPEAQRWATEQVASSAVQQWAQTSNNQHPVSLALQEAAKELFGLEETANWGRSNSSANVTARAIVESGREELRAFLSAQYDATQEYLKAEGITSIELFRGMSVSEKEYDVIRANDEGTHELSTRPLTSWSTDGGEAIKFGDGPRGVLLQATIPADRIFSLPLTGLGCLNEQEVVVLGGRDIVIASRVGGLNK